MARSGDQRAWPARLGVHVGALVLVLAIVSPFLDLDGVFTTDEGSYVTQARALTTTGWDIGYPFQEADPGGAFTPFHASVRSDNGTFAYVGHPLWPALLAGATGALGEAVGLRIITVLSLAVAAWVAWAIAEAVGEPRAAPWAFWITASSPLLASAWVTWAHVPSAVAGGLLVLGLLRSAEGARWVVVAAVGAVLGVLLRSESLLWAGAACAALVVVERSWCALRSGVIVAATAVLAFLLEGAWRGEIVGPSATTEASPVTSDLTARSEASSVTDHLRGLRLTLFDGAFGSGSGRLLAVAGGALALVAVVTWRLGRRQETSGVLLLSAAGLLAARIAAHSLDPVPGLVLAAPTLLLMALVPLRKELRWPLVAFGLFLVAIGLTVYPDGGSLQWGGRYLSPAMPLLAAAAAIGLAAVVDRPERPAKLLVIGASVLMVVQAVGAVVVPDRVREDTASAVAVAISAGPDVLLANGRQIARLDLDGWPDRCWLATPDRSGVDELRQALAMLEDAEVDQVTYVGFDAADLRAAGATVTDRVRGTRVGTLDIGGSGDWRPAEPYLCSAQ